MDKMELWDRVSKTNPSHTKQVNFGRKITAIDPYRQIENATREFGPAGIEWGWHVERVEFLSTNEVAVLIRLFPTSIITSNSVPCHIEQWGQSSLYIDKAEKKKDTDCMKKATTDGITKCLSYLGFNADVFLGKFDDNKYVQQRIQEEAQEKTPRLQQKDLAPLSDCMNMEVAIKVFKELTNKFIHPDDLKKIIDVKDFVKESFTPKGE